MILCYVVFVIMVISCHGRVNLLLKLETVGLLLGVHHLYVTLGGGQKCGWYAFDIFLILDKVGLHNQVLIGKNVCLPW